jgi:hypothetical protein
MDEKTLHVTLCDEHRRWMGSVRFSLSRDSSLKFGFAGYCPATLHKKNNNKWPLRALLLQLFIKNLALQALLRQLFIKNSALRALLRQLFIKNFGIAGSALPTLHKNGFCGLCSGNSSQKILLLRALLRQLFIKNWLCGICSGSSI